MYQKRSYFLATFVALILVGFTSAGDENADHLQPEERELVDWLISLQRAGWEDKDFDTYMKQWHEDATLVLARDEQPGEFDLAVDLKKLAATRKLRMEGPPLGQTLTMSDIKVSIDGILAVVSWRCISANKDNSNRELSRERYQLIRGDDGWKVFDNRVWFLGIENNGRKTAFDERYWERMDVLAEKAKRQGDFRSQRAALFDGYRFDHAHRAAERSTQLADASADDWIWRGIIAAIAYEPEDAKASFRKARELDPNCWLPSYAKGADWLDD